MAAPVDPAGPGGFVNGTTADADAVDARFDALFHALDRASVGLDAESFKDALATLLGLNSGTTVRRGKCVVATEQARTNVAYGLLTTPDKIVDVVLPTDGLILVSYRAMWKESAAAAAAATLCLDTTQVSYADATNAGPTGQAAGFDGSASSGVYKPLVSYPLGLRSALDAGVAYTGNVSPQVLGMVTSAYSEGFGGFCVVEADAGTYDVNVQFKASGGATVTVKNRVLRALAIGFG